ncbi:nuclear transport factor 2 family protein [Shimia litoralis]|uniref:Nuclear transport factor 2 family protein n=1 Tax=Shimia litoralis TaxID=420403 RepID=A0A4U7N557_9RHOB|nr:nuclear transport factor 2 family protein [Shimia litoralis]TKZ20758.1 nuclear transport factor 2 family protein [Shimia litoralis]
MEKREILETWYQRVWVEGDLDAIDDMFRPDTQAAGLIPEMQMGPDEFRELVPMFLTLVESPVVTLDKVMEDGDWVSALYSMHVTDSNSGKPVMGAGQLFVRFSGDKMVETYNSFDFMGFFEQIGLLPEQSLALCLTGQKIG